MSENDDTTQVPRSPTFEAIGHLANHPLVIVEPGKLIFLSR
jgi:hypothetical protein